MNSTLGSVVPLAMFCIVIAIIVNGANDHYTRGYNFPIGTTPKKIRFRARGHFLGPTVGAPPASNSRLAGFTRAGWKKKRASEI